MQKKLTILFAFAIFVLLVGWAATPAFAAQPECKGQNKNSVECGGSSGGGAPRDIPLCVTLEAVDPTGIGGIGGIEVDDDGVPILDDAGLPVSITETFCDHEFFPDAGGVHAGITDEGKLNIALWAGPFPRVELDFSDCIVIAQDTDPDCENRDIATNVDSILSGGKDVGDTSGLSGVTFSADEAFNFIPTEDGVPILFQDAPVKLVVRIDVFTGQIDTPKQSTRTINYGTRLDDCGSDPVTVTRLTDGCWTVESNAPIPGVDEGDKACLIQDIGHGRKAQPLLQGRYHMPFFMTLKEITFNELGNPDGVASCG